MNSVSHSSKKPFSHAGADVSALRKKIVLQLLNIKDNNSKAWIQHRGGGILSLGLRISFGYNKKEKLDFEFKWPDAVEQLMEDIKPNKKIPDTIISMLLNSLEEEKKVIMAIILNEEAKNKLDTQQWDDKNTHRVFYGMISKTIRKTAPDMFSTNREEFSIFMSELREQCLSKVIGLLEVEKAKEGFRSTSGVDDYAGLFPLARKIKRILVMHVGPTNSGKTYTALKELKSASSGMYLAPLRLMALETFDNLSAELPANLITGEECIVNEGARHTSSTVEMLDTATECDVGVLDEIQMLSDASRGWAWTRAVIGAPVHTLHMTGSADALPYVQKIAAICKEELIVHYYERLSPLIALEHAVPLKEIQKGDAIVAFSRKDVFILREIIRETGLSCAMLYGALGPDVRKAEAARFRSGDADVLVATDAIGMGLNLPISRVLLSETVKFDGEKVRALNPSEIRQICGRAGRYKSAEVKSSGYAGVIAGNSPGIVKKVLNKNPDIQNNVVLYAMPHWDLINDAASLHKTQDLDYLLKWCSNLFMGDYRSTDIKDMLTISEALNKTLSLKDRYRYLGCPASTNSRIHMDTLTQWSLLHSKNIEITPPQNFSKTLPDDSNGLIKLESASSIITMWLWLNLRWPEVYKKRDSALAIRNVLSDMIERTLTSKAIYRRCNECGKRLGAGHHAPTCFNCY